ncbi:hypothetical protein, partial [Lacticaseibacillus paracasei]
SNIRAQTEALKIGTCSNPNLMLPALLIVHAHGQRSKTHSTDLFKVPEMGCRLGLSKSIKETVDFMIDGFFVSANQPG